VPYTHVAATLVSVARPTARGSGGRGATAPADVSPRTPPRVLHACSGMAAPIVAAAAALEVVRVPSLADNYIWLLHEPVSGRTAAVDPGDAAVTRAALTERCAAGWPAPWGREAGSAICWVAGPPRAVNRPPESGRCSRRRRTAR
jgi:hypothetical protein